MRGEGFRSVVFDCDSTLAAIEGIDELAGPEHAGPIRALTEEAMQGLVPLEEVYGRRLELIRPSRERVEALSRAYVAALVPDARETVAALLSLGKTVRVLSGGLRPPVEALARELGLGPEAVGAVGIDFDGGGAYGGFERGSPLARSGGKEIVLRAWALPRPALLVGDGATDLEARPAVDAFAAYMGAAFRPPVAAGADVVLRDPSLAPVLALAAGPADRASLAGSPWAELLRRGDALLAGELSPDMHRH
ncbi:MAG TPA: HAD-IB family phosphatase [Longimicrobiaceae bacterium]|nr:HAD-IB family phosphatase [Longimicrobiaceae bacterium]